MKKKYKLQKIAILLLVLGCINLALFILAIFIDQYQYYFLGGALGLLVINIIIFIVMYRLARKSIDADTERIIHGLKKYKNNEKEIIEISSNNKKLKSIADEVSLLSVTGQDLVNGHEYHDENFISYLSTHLDTEISQLAYVNIAGNIDVNPILKRYKNTYVNKKENSIELFIYNFANREQLEQVIVDYLNSGANSTKLYFGSYSDGLNKSITLEDNKKKARCFIIYYPDYEISQFNLVSKLPVSKTIKNVDIYDIERNPYPLADFNQIVKLVNSRKDKDNIDIKDLVLSAMYHLPFSHIIVEMDGVKRFFKWKEVENYADMVEVPYKKDFVLYNKNGHYLKVSFIGDSQLDFVDPQAKEVMETLLNTLLDIGIYTFKENDKVRDKKTFDNLILKSGNYSYEIDKDYNLISLSDNLLDKFKKNPEGKKCYKQLFNLDKPCKNCPLNGEISKQFIKVGSGDYTFTKVNNKQNRKIYVLKSNHKVLPQKDLYEKVIDSINNDKRGYLMLFKLDYLQDLSIKYKISIEELTSKAIDLLSSYSLDGNLYQKEEDEYAFVLEYFRFADCVELANTLSNAFEDKAEHEEKGILLTPKIILLSYPLEVNNLYSLISLSRTLFARADKRGMLYRLSSDPVYVNKKREYLEILEESLKNDNIPIIYYRIKDNENPENNILRVDLDYRDSANEVIREDAITLYAKLEKYYLSLIERTFKSVNYQEGYDYIFYLSREALDSGLFINITNILNKLKIDLSRIIIESDEIYLRANKDLVSKYAEMGYQFGLSSIEEDKPYNLPIKVKYIKVNEDKFKQSSKYGQKLIEIHKLDIPFLVDSKIDGISEKYIEVPGGEYYNKN